MNPLQQIPQQLPRASGTSLTVAQTLIGGGSEGILDPSGKPPPKKRGRKPKSYYAELEAKAAAQKLAAEETNIARGEVRDVHSINCGIEKSGKIAQDEDEEEEEIKMPWNNKPPSGGEDLDCLDEFQEDQQLDIVAPT